MKIHKHGQSYRIKIDNHWINLGRDYELACVKAQDITQCQTIAGAMHRYKREIMPRKAIKTQITQIRQADILVRVFGHLPVSEIRQKHAIEYLDSRGNVSANREIALLRHVLTKCVHWGLVDQNPLMRMQYRNPEGKRDRVVSNEEIRYVMRRANSRERYLIWLVYLTGLRREDALRINDMSFRDGFLHVTEGKTRKRVRIIQSRSLDKLKRRLQPGYFNISESGIDSAWQRLRKRLKPYDLFQLKDLRAAHAGEVDDSGGDATRQLGHSSRTITQKHYLRAGRIISPIR